MSNDLSSNTTGRIPLTRPETLIWVGQQLDPQAPIYNTAFQFRLRETIDADRWEQALRDVVDQSEPLRTSIDVVEGVPFKRVHPSFAWDLLRVDLDESVLEGRVHPWCQRRARRPFVLDGCLFDTALLRSPDGHWTWYFCQHHVVCDAWSVAEVYRRVGQRYRALGEGQVEREPRQAWRAIPPEVDAVTTPPDSPVVPVTKFYGQDVPRVSAASQRRDLVRRSDPLSEAVSRLSEDPVARSFSKDMSQLNVLLTLLFAYLSRVSDQETFCVGVPFHNRRSAAEKTQLGLFVEFHPITLTMTPGATFRSLLEQVKIAVNQFLMDAVSGRTAGGTHAQFNVVLNYIHARFGADDVATEAIWLHPGCHDRQHHMRWHVEDYAGDGRVDLKIDFNEDVFPETRQSTALGHIRRLIEAMARGWDQAIDAVDLLSEDERTRQLDAPKRNVAAAPLPNVLEGWEAAVRRFPDRVALRQGNNVWTYLELQAEVARFRHALRQAGVASGQRVGICLRRSPEVMVSILGVLQSGAVWVPLDPSWPERRIEQVARDAGLVGVVALSSFPQQGLGDVTRIVVDMGTADAEAACVAEASQVTADDTAYLLYTSGSTGTPKGVAVTHGSLANYLAFAQDRYAADGPVSMPLFTPLTFDLTVTSLFLPLRFRWLGGSLPRVWRRTRSRLVGSGQR